MSPSDGRARSRSEREGADATDGIERRGDRREEEPLIAGTPLDEMTPVKTPGASLGAGAGSVQGSFPFPFPPRRQESSATIRPQVREGSGDTLTASGGIGPIPEHAPLGEEDMATRQMPQRPTLKTSELGSVRHSSG